MDQCFTIFSDFLRDLVVYNDLEAACNDPDVDGLIISTPNYTHLDVVEVAVKSGKHILLEKPMATTIEDAYKITQIKAKMYFFFYYFLISFSC